MQEPLFSPAHGLAWDPKPIANHLVHFYEPHFFPAPAVADYLYSGIELQEGAVIIATPDHTRMIKGCLEACGVQAQALERAGSLTCVDAKSTLAKIGDYDPLNEKTIDALFGPLIVQTITSSRSKRTRVFGEMVDFLARDGEYDTCMELERLCHGLLSNYSIRLYCAYSLEGFAEESCAEAMCRACDLHDEIAPLMPELHPKRWSSLLLRRSQASHAETRTRKAAEKAVRYWEGEYARLFDAHVAHWRDCIQRSVAPPMSECPKPVEEMNRMVEQALTEILMACSEACAERNSCPEGSAEWHKRTGEILAYGKLTNVLDNLQRFGPTRERG